MGQLENRYCAKWAQVEALREPPKYLGSIKEHQYAEISAKILAQEDDFVDQIVESLYDGDYYILKEAFPKPLMEEMKRQTIGFAKHNESVYHPMVEGCPDFQRIIDLEVSKLYSYTSVRRSSFFFPWNSDPIECFDEVNKRWRVFKFMSGNQLDAYEKNTPKDGIIDRVQVALYPRGGGGLAIHEDSCKNQRIIIGAMMSRRGEDYSEGGFFAIDKNKNKVDLEVHLDVGDIVIGYPTIPHGVVAVDPEEDLVWEDFKGRWFLGLYSNDSNHVKNRSTAKRLEESNSKNTIPATF